MEEFENLENLNPEAEENAVEDETSPSEIEESTDIPAYAPPQVELPSEEEPTSQPALPEEETKFRKFLRKFIRWTAGLLIVFGLGLMVGVFFLYRPATKETGQVRAELKTAQDKIENLESLLSEAEAHNAYLQSLEDDNIKLKNQQQFLELHILVLDVRVDVANARLALSKEDTAQARITLDKTSGMLDEINTMMEPDQQGVVESMKQRLDLVLSEMENDPYAAQSDLDVLATSLLQLEDSLFSE